MKKGWQLNSCMSLSITVTVDEISMSITVISQNVGDAEYRNTGAFHYPAWTFRIYRPLLRYTEPYQMERKAGEAEPPGLFQTVSEWSSWYGHHNASDVYPGRSSLITACFFRKAWGFRDRNQFIPAEISYFIFHVPVPFCKQPHFPDSPGHIKRTAWDISRAEGTPPYWSVLIVVPEESYAFSISK